MARKKKQDPYEAFIDKLKAKAQKDKRPFRRGWDKTIPWTLPFLPELDLYFGRDQHGGWGIPAGSIVLFHGWPKSGKSSSLCRLIANCQRPDPWGHRPRMVPKLAENEGGHLSPAYMRTIGIDPTDIIWCHPDHLEGGWEEWRIEMVNSLTIPEEQRFPILFGYDSISNAEPAESADKPMTEAGRLAAHAVINSRVMRRITRFIQRTGSIGILIGQNKSKVDTYSSAMATTIIGGQPVFYAAVINVHVKRKAYLVTKKDDDDEKVYVKTGMQLEMVVDMNKVGMPGGKAEVILDFRTGFNWHRSLHQALHKTGLIEKAGDGAWWRPTRPIFLRKDKEKKELVVKYNGQDGIRNLPEPIQQHLYGLLRTLPMGQTVVKVGKGEGSK